MEREPKIVRMLFNDDMARAIVQGRKTVTRRPIVPQPVIPPDVGQHLTPGETLTMLVNEAWQSGFVDVRAPCAPGDILIGRECWCELDRHHYVTPDLPRDVMRGSGKFSGKNGCGYRASTSADGDEIRRNYGYKWRPSIHMPDWAARIRRRVVSVTVERVQDVTIQDAVREGFPTDRHGGTDARNDFLCAWDDIYINRGLASAVNPWVWRIEFERENVQDVSNGR